MNCRVAGGGRVCASLLVGLAPLLVAAPVAAQQSWAIPGFDTAGLGVFLGYAWGGDRGLEWGVEGFATHYAQDIRSCSSEARAGVGPLLRLSALGISRLAVTGALHGGGEFQRSTLALDGELGGTIAYQDGGARPAVHSGLLVESLYWNAYARQEWLLPSYSVGGGMRVQATFGEPSFCAEGRLFRGECGEPQLARLRAPDGLARSPDATRWVRRAREECASVPAFLQLALELAELGAPRALVARALAAADEERGHAQHAVALASLFGGARALLEPPPFRFRPPLPRARALQRLATESWADGYLNEGLAATIARAELCERPASEEAATLELIAREEARHAELALDVLLWTLERAPALVRSLRVPSHDTHLELETPTSLPPGALRALTNQSRIEARRELRALSS